jgi:hypothetical protein
MDVLVMLDEPRDQSPVLARVNSVPAPQDSEQPSRDVVTLYGEPTPDAVALALAAAVECHRSAPASGAGSLESIGQVGVWPECGAVGDAAWRDDSGALVTRDLKIPSEVLHATATQLLRECGQVIGRLVASLSMPDWPEGARRAITVSLGPILELTAPVVKPLEAMVERWREADSLAYEYESE